MEYQVSKLHFSSADGVSSVCGWICTPEGQPRGIIQISHGMCEYLNRYQRFIEDGLKAGFIVCGHDHIGHGESADPELYGYFGRENGHRSLVADLHHMTRIVKKKHPDLPLFLLGHSMGSFITRLYLSKYSDELAGVILSGTGGPNPLAGIGSSISQGVAAAKGPLYRSHRLDQMAFGTYNKRFSPSRTTKDWLTRDEDVVDRYLSDPKCMFLFTACGYRDLFHMVDLVNRSAWYETLNPELPMLLISGDMDPVGDYGKGVEKVFANLQKAGIRDVTMTLYPEARHELLNELNYEEVEDDLFRWIQEHLPNIEQ